MVGEDCIFKVGIVVEDQFSVIDWVWEEIP